MYKVIGINQGTKNMVGCSVKMLAMRLSFAQWFKLRRDIVGLTQTDIAKAVGVRPQTVSNWEKEVSIPSLNPEQTLILCSLLDVSLKDLVKGFKGEMFVSGTQEKSLNLES